MQVISEKHENASWLLEVRLGDSGEGDDPLSVKHSVRRVELNYHPAHDCWFWILVQTYLGQPPVVNSQLAHTDLLRKGVMRADEYRCAPRLRLIRQFAEGRMGDRIKTTEGFIEHQEPHRT